MGNNKNRLHRHKNHQRHVFVKKKLPQKHKKHASKPVSEHHYNVEGSRIINLHQLQQYMGELNAHSAQCGDEVVLTGEDRDGLASVLSSNCSTCGHSISLKTSEKVKGPKGYSRWECNLAAVWGQIVTGGGHNQLQESMSIVGVPVMSKASFIQTERGIGEWWKVQLKESMIEAGKEEKRMAIERGDYHQGVPAITVYVDGGWSKRSHKHSYNANSGVAIIIGKATGKLLHIGVRNKYCYACSQGIPQDKHTCYRNWSSSSSEMETDIILEGFRAAESTHGVRYMRVVGDGDSSVYSTLLLNVSDWGRDIKKLECANHVCKCYRGALERLVQENPKYKGAGGLTAKMRQRLVSSARCAIKMHSKELDRKKAIKLLERDLINGPLHCFGEHDQCSPDFCSTAKEKTQPLDGSVEQHPPSSHDESVDTDDPDILGIITTQERLWRETTADSPAIEEDSRRGGRISTKPDQKMIHDIQVAASRLVAKVAQLISNETTNLVESWMHVRSKYDGGKVINRSQSGSWEHRCMGAGLQHNFGKEWGPSIWSRMTTSPPNNIFSTTAETSARKKAKECTRKARDDVKARRRKGKYSRKDNSVAARKAYSRHDNEIEPEDVTDDISPEILDELKKRYYQTNVVVSTDEAAEIEFATRDQAGSDRWKSERRKRLTASKVGGISKMRKTTKRGNKVRELLYSTFRGNVATRYGMEMEDVTRTEYLTYQQQNKHPEISVKNCGLFVSHDNPWLAATPDGLVHDPSEDSSSSGLLEIKNPHSIRGKTISEACNDNKSFFLKQEKTAYTLKQQHDYFYQVQCQLYCVNKEWCDFVVRTERDLKIQRIYRDREWWAKQMPRLSAFYHDALLPELVNPRFGKGSIREPSTVT